MTLTVDGGSPPVLPSVRRRRPVAAVLLGVLVLSLAAAAAFMELSTAHRQQPADRALAALRAQAKADDQEGETPGAFTPPAPDLALLQREYQAVRQADRAIDAAVGTWRTGGHAFGMVVTAIERCYHRADDFDRATAPYAVADLEGVVPQKIDLKNAATDCGGTAMRAIAGPLS